MTVEDSVISEAIELLSEAATIVVCGMASGVDMCGKAWAEARQIPVDKYHANWKRFGPKAGPIRNAIMAKNADALVLFWDGLSPGSANMLKQAKFYGLEIIVNGKPL